MLKLNARVSFIHTLKWKILNTKILRNIILQIK